ncbi:uncharacterized protein CLUP02_04466 [Colletotrichum lupini]|uniref:Uncharacterized protein n=1 Tax=Colletotrichum lupini TaxID=145971 RepID=A0A9Q8SKC9_9PEZI|nr:uncharacterized protein CLUP02_04466 [Colletotrichum lupini]UQC78987.1 hypothetical protein CLUP02_04466 [Colletotrichum lupini]
MGAKIANQILAAVLTVYVAFSNKRMSSVPQAIERPYQSNAMPASLACESWQHPGSFWQTSCRSVGLVIGRETPKTSIVVSVSTAPSSETDLEPTTWSLVRTEDEAIVSEAYAPGISNPEAALGSQNTGFTSRIACRFCFIDPSRSPGIIRSLVGHFYSRPTRVGASFSRCVAREGGVWILDWTTLKWDGDGEDETTLKSLAPFVSAGDELRHDLYKSFESPRTRDQAGAVEIDPVSLLTGSLGYPRKQPCPPS